MSIRPVNLDALQTLGYNPHEARFLYLVATHSGYFTRRQFLNFSAKAKGWSVHHFTTKTLAHKHARAVEYGRQTYVFNLYSRRIYDPIDKHNLRNRRLQSHELIHTRLLILDFVLAHPDYHYLETEAEKVAYFHHTLGLPLPVLPGRIYKGIKSNRNTKRHFIERFPIFLADNGSSLTLLPAVTFTFCDSALPSLARYVTHLRAYEKFLRRLPAFNFIYASPNPSKFQRAAAFFTRLFQPADQVNAQHLARYFQVRLLWDRKKYNSLTRADRDLLRQGDERYDGEPFESLYQKWVREGLSEADLNTLLGPSPSRQERKFHTYVLPEAYDIFHRDSGACYRPARCNVWLASRSDSRSAPCDS